MMKYQYVMSILLLSILGSQINNTTIGFCADQREEKITNSVTSEMPDVFSHLFPLRNKLYPNYDPRSIKVKAISDPEEQFTQRQYINDNYRSSLKYTWFSQNIVPDSDNIGIIFIPTEMKVSGVKDENKKIWKGMVSFVLEDINVTVVFFDQAVAITFEYEEDAENPKSLESVHQKLTEYVSWMKNMIFSYDLPENQKIYQGNDLDETKLYSVKAQPEKEAKYAKQWVRYVRWWRGLGRFGISFSKMPNNYHPNPPYGIMDPYMNPDVFSQLFPLRNQLYPVFVSGMTGPTRTINAFPDPKEQFTQRKYINEYYRTKVKHLFPQITVPENVGLIYLPTEMKIKYGSRKLWKCLFSFFHEEVNVTVVFLGLAAAITFEYEEDVQTPESLEAISQKLSKFLPWMEHLIFSYDLPENQRIYQGNGLDETKLYHVKARQEKVLDGNWVNDVRWWRGPGRFGISSSGGVATRYISEQELLLLPTLPVVNLYDLFESSEE